MKPGNRFSPRAPQEAPSLCADERRLSGPSPTRSAMKPRHLVPFAAALALLTALAVPVQAKLAWNKKAQKYDPAIKACTACHVDEKPKKDDHGKPLTERGQWLLDQKAAKGAKDIDLSWLKDFPNNGK